MGYTRSSADWAGHPLIPPILALLPPDAPEPWRGTARELLAVLTPLAPEHEVRSPAWPKSPSSLTHWLGIITRALGRRGIAVTIASGAPSIFTLAREPRP